MSSAARQIYNGAKGGGKSTILLESHPPPQSQSDSIIARLVSVVIAARRWKLINNTAALDIGGGRRYDCSCVCVCVGEGALMLSPRSLESGARQSRYSLSWGGWEE